MNEFRELKVKTGDLGPVRLELREKKIVISKQISGDTEYGFSFLIPSPGLYTLKNLKINVETLDKGSSDVLYMGTNTFLACFPVILRPLRNKDFLVKAGQKHQLSDILKSEFRTGYTGFITAQDRNGSAAFIGLGEKKDLLLLTRDDKSGALECRFSLEKNSGGNDV